MTLTITDSNYINHRMDAYDIKYQEIYDEIKDHMVSAVEAARAGGDERNIVYVFDELTEAHFPGFWAFEKISKQCERAYRGKLRRMLWANMKYYLNWQNTGVIILLVITGFYLPQNKIMSLIMIVALVLIAIITQGYATRQSRKIEVKDGKKSMVKNHVVRYGSMLMLMANLLLNCIGFFGREYHINYLNPRYFHPVVYMLLLSFFIIYGLSSVRLFQQELKIFDSSEFDPQ